MVLRDKKNYILLKQSTFFIKKEKKRLRKEMKTAHDCCVTEIMNYENNFFVSADLGALKHIRLIRPSILVHRSPQ
jgi:hypothetical protein